MKRKILICAIGFINLCNLCLANTGASFLNIGTSARAISMGGAYVGVADDANAISYNPAGLSQLNRNEITAQHTEWISDVKHDFLAGAFPLRNSTVGFSIIYLSQGKLEGRTEDRAKSADFSAYDVATTISYSKSINEKVKLGTNLKDIKQKIYDNKTEISFGTEYTPINVLALRVGYLESLNPEDVTNVADFKGLG